MSGTGCMQCVVCVCVCVYVCERGCGVGGLEGGGVS